MMDQPNKEELRQTFCSLLESTGRKDIRQVIEQLDQIQFFDAPASSTKHLNEAGGLMRHSLNVYRLAMKMADAVRSECPTAEIDNDSIKIVALLHDVCKAPRYLLGEDGKYNKDFTHLPIGHGEKSVIMLLRMGLMLTDEEIVAIRWHMGPWQLPLHNEEQQLDYRSASEQYPLTAILHTADTLAAQIIEMHNTTP